MTRFITACAALGLGAAALPALADSHGDMAMDPREVTCAEFITMDDEGKAEIVTAALAESPDMELEEALDEVDQNCREESNATVSVYGALIGEEN
ncbi:HdeA/HdeB family chaperone [Roseivivax sp. CAU 1761]